MEPEFEPEHLLTTCSICTESVRMVNPKTRHPSCIQCNDPRHTCHDECLQRWVQVKHSHLAARIAKSDIPEGRLCATCPMCKEDLPNTDLPASALPVQHVPWSMCIRVPSSGAPMLALLSFIRNAVEIVTTHRAYHVVEDMVHGACPAELDHDEELKEEVLRAVWAVRTRTFAGCMQTDGWMGPDIGTIMEHLFLIPRGIRTWLDDSDSDVAPGSEEEDVTDMNMDGV